MYNDIIICGGCVLKYKYSLICLLSTSILANEPFNIEDDFLKSLNEVSQVATKTKLNRDKTTSFVNVIQAKKLKKLGVDSVYNALKYIPGIELSKEATGVKNVIFRGSITKGEVKFMVDGVEINNAYRASFYYFLDFPIEMVSRIEVLRGTGSVLHGSGAISGVINIITKSSQNTNENEFFLTGGSYTYGKGGARLNLLNNDYKLSLDAYYQADDKEIKTTDQRLKDYSVGLNFKAYDFELNSRIKSSTQGAYYGLFGSPDTISDKYQHENQSFFSNLKYAKKLTNNNKINFVMNYQEYNQKLEDFHPSLNGDLDSNFKEKSYCAQIEFQNNSDNGEFLIGIRAKHSQSLKTELSGHPLISNIVSPNLERDIKSVYLNNNYLLTDDINLAVGLRYDDYSDFGENTSPDIGLVYRTTDNLSFKLKYAHAFRAPSWTELSGLSGNSSLKSETSKGSEFGAIYKYDSDTKISLNAYDTTIEDYIQNVGNQYSQNSEISLQGTELELVLTPLHNLEIGFISSYSEAEDKDGKNIDAITNFLTTSSLIYTSTSGLVFGSTLRYKNTQNMENDIIFDQSISYIYKDFTVNLVAKNLFDSDVIYYDNTHDETNPIHDAQRVVLLKTTWEF